MRCVVFPTILCSKSPQMCINNCNDIDVGISYKWYVLNILLLTENDILIINVVTAGSGEDTVTIVQDIIQFSKRFSPLKTTIFYIRQQ